MSDAASTLCRACALCCDGTLFAYVTVPATEANALRDRGLLLGAGENGPLRLPQRCAGLAGRCCAVYADRPTPCRAYRCLLATALEEGELPLAEALTLVEGAHHRLATLAAALGEDAARSPVPQVRAVLVREGALEERAALAWNDAKEYLRRHFTGRHG